MSNFKYQGYQYNLTSAYEFLKEYCIRNHQVADQNSLNKPVIQLKRELNTLIGQIKILTSEPSITWNPSVVYEAGEIVSYFTTNKVDYTKEEIENSYYLALPNDGQNIAIKPNENKDFWKQIKLQDLYPRLYLQNYALKNQEIEDWDSTKDLSVINLKTLKNKLDEFKVTLDKIYDAKYISFQNLTPYKVTDDTQPTHKAYVDSKIQATEEKISNLKNDIGEYVILQGSNKTLTSSTAGSNIAMTTPKGGILPAIANSTPMGSSANPFGTIYAKTFSGTATKALYADIAEIIETDLEFEAGDILSLDIETGDFKLYQPHNEVFGVVSSKPGIILNASAKGVLIAHKGQVPVKVKGLVKKGQIIIADGAGIGIAKDSIIPEERPLKIGIALESSNKKSTKLIKTFI